MSLFIVSAIHMAREMYRSQDELGSNGAGAPPTRDEQIAQPRNISVPTEPNTARDTTICSLVQRIFGQERARADGAQSAPTQTPIAFTRGFFGLK